MVHYIVTFTALVSFARLTSALSIPTLSAAYFATNEASGNVIMSADILSNGKLSYANAVSTGGIGHDISGQDGLFSQHSVVVHTSRALLAAVNAGSNTVSLFGINPFHPSQLNPIGKAVNSGGNLPNAITFNKPGTEACVLNTGVVSGVQCFSVDPFRGLTPLGSFHPLALNLTTNPTEGPGTASDILFSSDDSQLTVPVKGRGSAAAPGWFAIWNVNTSARELLSTTYQKIVLGNGLPFGSVLIPGENAMLSSDGSAAVDILDMATGTATQFPIPGAKVPCWAVHSKSTGSFYMADTALSSIIEVAVPGGSTLTPNFLKTYALQNGSLALDLSVGNVFGKDYLYVLSPGTRAVQVMSLDGPGKASYVQSLDLSTAAPQVKTSINLQGIATFAPL